MHIHRHFIILMLAFCTITITKAQDDVVVAPLVKVEWGQYEPYNQSCPMVGDTRAAAGCVALAMAQAMTVYNQPSIDVNDMEAVADNIFRCGESVGMNYSNSSTAFIDQQLKALINTFGYDRDMVIFSREYHDFSAWQNTIIDELEAGRPVMMSAADAKYGGHSFIIDGYRRDSDGDDKPEFHINWGWCGDENGYYQLDNLQTKSYRFTENQKILIGFKPEDKHNERECYWEGICQMSATDAEAGSGSKIQIRLGFANRYYTTQSISYNVYLVSPTGERTKVNRNKVYAMNIDTDERTSPVFNLDTPSLPGTYNIVVEYSPYAGFTTYTMPISGQTSFNVHATSGIHQPQTTIEDDAVVYNAFGQKTTRRTKGIVIINGRKFVNAK